MKIIFLDIDGVLNNDDFLREARKKSVFERDIDEIDPACVKLLNKLIEQTDARVVISSSWRIIMKLCEIRNVLEMRGFTGKIISKTPQLGFPGRVRGDEIKAWLEELQREPVESFVILDDDSDMADLIDRLVQTSAATGLTETDVERAVTLLNQTVTQ